MEKKLKLLGWIGQWHCTEGAGCIWGCAMHQQGAWCSPWRWWV